MPLPLNKDWVARLYHLPAGSIVSPDFRVGDEVCWKEEVVRNAPNHWNATFRPESNGVVLGCDRTSVIVLWNEEDKISCDPNDLTQRWPRSESSNLTVGDKVRWRTVGVPAAPWQQVQEQVTPGTILSILNGTGHVMVKWEGETVRCNASDLIQVRTSDQTLPRTRYQVLMEE